MTKLVSNQELLNKLVQLINSNKVTLQGNRLVGKNLNLTIPQKAEPKSDVATGNSKQNIIFR